MTEIGIFDPRGINNNPINDKKYSDNYKLLSKNWTVLPAYTKANEIINSITDFQLTFIISGTGSGKTVLVPKFALHYTNYKGKIGVTLPKKDATRKAAEYAADTLDVKLGQEIGYVHSNSPKEYYGPTNRIVYMTDGLLNMLLVNDPYLDNYNIIIIDEVHERKVQIDIILAMIKNIIKSGKRPTLKFIIMSATIDIDKYLGYFGDIKSNVINISGEPNLPIDVIFSDKPIKNFVSESQKIITTLYSDKITDPILVFVTTSNETFDLCRRLRPKFQDMYCAELFAESDPKLKVYATEGDRYKELGDYNKKLVISTNVAESSITIAGLKYVIDSGMELFSYFDPETGANVLERRKITKAQSLQRRGRVGRTEPGICYHLLTEDEFAALDDYPEPDILKQDITLDLIKLSINSGSLSGGLTLLNSLMDPPKKKYIDFSKDVISLYKISDKDIISNFGKYIVQFSTIQFNRIIFLLLSVKYKCLKEASWIVGLLETIGGDYNKLMLKDVEYINFVKKHRIDCSDHLTSANLIKQYLENRTDKKWLNKNGLNKYVFENILRESQKNYYKVKSLEIKFDTEIDEQNVNKRILECLKESHKHLICSDHMPEYTSEKRFGEVYKHSVYVISSKKPNIRFLYDSFNSINGNWEYKFITQID